ncbi:hypothetical protein CRYUN_Cryun34aG0090200 [Craigia yunnanensis]
MGNSCSFSISTEDTISRCWNRIAGQTSYICKLEENLKALGVALEELKVLKDDVKCSTDLAEKQLLKRLNQVQAWLSRAETLITEAEELINDAPQEREKLCLADCFSKNFWSSYKFGKQVTRKLEEVAELKTKGFF